MDGVTHLVVMPKGYLLFPCVDQIREHILEACKDNPHVRNIVIDASAVRDADFTTAKVSPFPLLKFPFSKLHVTVDLTGNADVGR